jgi:CzcA family heavy metal efflux pump
MNRLIRWSIDHHLLVMVASVVLVVIGIVIARDMPVDVFPDLTAPTVTIVTEAHGLAPEEVETLVTFPIEAAMNGSTGVRRVRSASGVGISMVWVEFDWRVPLWQARQTANEKLQLAASQLPADIAPPQVAPTSSVMGEVLFLAVSFDDAHRATDEAGIAAQRLETRTVADHVIRRRLLSVAGVSQVIPIGGDVRQAQVLLRPESLLAHGLSFDDVARALRTTSQNASGGFVQDGQQELLVRAIGRATDLHALGATVVDVKNGQPILVQHLGEVRYGPKTKRGEGSVNAVPAVVFAVMKQPTANTLSLTADIDRVLDQLRPSLPAGLVIHTELFRQESFIRAAVNNVAQALRDGALLVAIIILLFLANGRATFISLAALPVSLVVAVLALKALGTTLNTMTIGGLTIAIGSLVDDAIIDVENVLRRLREEQAKPAGERAPLADVVYRASVEVRRSIVFATVIIVVVFLPLFFLSGLEGRMLQPLGFAFIVALLASLVVAMTLTPAMCAWLLTSERAMNHDEGRVMRALKGVYAPALDATLAHGRLVAFVVVTAVTAAVAVLPFLGRSFLPEFNEGSLTVNAITLPGTSLPMSDRLGRRVEEALLALPEVKSTTRRTGRAELDEHAQDVNAAEIDVGLDFSHSTRSKEAFLAVLRQELARVSGVVVTVGQPLSHRIDHLLSGTRAAIAIKIFGDDLSSLHAVAEQVRAITEGIPGAVDVSLEQQPDIPQIVVRSDPVALARVGMTSGALSEAIEARLAGATVSTLVEQQRLMDVVVKIDSPERQDVDDVRDLRIETPAVDGRPGISVPLRGLASVTRTSGPNTIVREGVQRKMVVQANVAERDLTEVVDDIRAAVAKQVTLPEGMFIVYGGQFESARDAARTIGGLSLLAIIAVFSLLAMAYRSGRNAVLTLVNLPLALIGGVFAVAVTSGSISTAALVGFVALFGIATRNGILLVSHYEHLMQQGCDLATAVRRGSAERLTPVLMTALCAGLALVPLVIAGNESGNEIQAPMGVVILGGLLSATALNMFVLPALFLRFGASRSRTQTP